MKQTKNLSFDIGIKDTDKKAVVTLLRAVVADEFVLYTKTLNFHWNVIGVHFGPLHKLFQDNYEMLLQIVDDISERIRSLGDAAPGSFAEYLSLTQLVEAKGKTEEGTDLVQKLYDDHLQIIRLLRKSIALCEEKHNDVGTGNFLTDILEQHEKAAWMLRAHLEK